MKTFDIIMYVLAVVCFLLAVGGVTTSYGEVDRRRPINFIALGLLLWVLVPLVNLIWG